MQVATRMLAYFILLPCSETNLRLTDGYDCRSAQYLTAPLCYCIFRKIWQAPRLLWQCKTPSWQGQGAPVCGTRLAQMKRDENNPTHTCTYCTAVNKCDRILEQQLMDYTTGLISNNLQWLQGTIVWAGWIWMMAELLKPDWCTEMWDTFSKPDKMSQRSKS